MFNEGLDIRDIDLVMFLRPTQSPTVFLQQLGRGLRKSKNKKYLNVLDFIGNYKKANFIPIFLSNGSHIDKKNNRYDSMDFEYPDECIVDFDLQVIDIFKKQAEQELSIKDKIKNEFDRIKAEIGKVPSRMEMFTQMDSSLYDSVRTKSRLNIFGIILYFLKNG